LLTQVLPKETRRRIICGSWNESEFCSGRNADEKCSTGIRRSWRYFRDEGTLCAQ
jgi:hypothetical protein